MPADVVESGTSKSAVSRRFVAATGKKLEAWMHRDLGELDLAVIMIDGLHVDDHVVLVALGFDVTGAKHLLGIHEGATENRESCKALLANLVERGVESGRSTLFASALSVLDSPCVTATKLNAALEVACTCTGRHCSTQRNFGLARGNEV